MSAGPVGLRQDDDAADHCGRLHPDAGRVWISGKEVVGPRVFVPPEKRRVGFVFQDYALFPHLTAERNVAFGFARRAGSVVSARSLSLIGLA